MTKCEDDLRSCPLCGVGDGEIHLEGCKYVKQPGLPFVFLPAQCARCFGPAYPIKGDGLSAVAQAVWQTTKNKILCADCYHEVAKWCERSLRKDQ